MHLMNTATSVLSAPYFRLECVQQLRKNAELLHISNFLKLNNIILFSFYLGCFRHFFVMEAERTLKA
jgi:hypothetical protein